MRTLVAALLLAGPMLGCTGPAPNVAKLIAEAASLDGTRVTAIGYAFNDEGAVLCETKDELRAFNPRCISILSCPAAQTREWKCALGTLPLDAKTIGEIARSGRLVRVTGELRRDEPIVMVHSAAELSYAR
jgi:hypothetical protein